MAEPAEQQGSKTARGGYQDYLAPVWRNWKLCFLAPLGLGVAAYLLTWLLPEWYEGRSTVRVANVDYGGKEISLTEVTPRDLETLFTTGEVLGKVLTTLKLSKEHDITESDLAESLLTINAPRATHRIDISARMPSPQLAQDVANLVAREGIGQYVKSMQTEYETMLQKLQKEAQEAKRQLDQAEGDLGKFQTTCRLETLSQRVVIHRELGATREKQVLELRTDLTVARAKIAVYEKQLKAEDLTAQAERVLADSPPLKQGLAELEKVRAEREAFRKKSRIETLRAEATVQQALKSQRETDRAALTEQQAALKAKADAVRKSLADESMTIRLDRKLVRDSAFQQALATLSGKALQELLAINMTESVVNAVYIALKTDLASTLASQEKISAQLAAIDKAAETGDKKLADLRERLFSLERQLEALTLRHELAMKRVMGAAQAVAQDRGVLTPLYLQALQKLIATKSQEAATQAELDVLEQVAGESQKALADLEDRLFEIERMHRDKTFQRDRFQKAASQTMTELQALRNVPKWPPVSLTVTPAPLPTAPASPRRARITAAAALVSALLIWAGVVYVDRRRRG